MPGGGQIRTPPSGPGKAHLRGDSASCWGPRHPEADFSKTHKDWLRPRGEMIYN